MKPSTTTSRNPVLTLAAAVAAVAVPLLLSAGVARAQYQVDNGRANDANNLIGSGGYNSGGIPAPETVTGNQIVTGNVTGGKAFRGPVPYFAPNTFSGPSATRDFDTSIRDSSGAPVSFNRANTNFANNTLPFYSTVAAPPPGFAATPTNRVFVPTAIAGATVYRQPRLDERLGVITDTPETLLPQPGQLLIPGPVDASANPTFISASPLTGVRTFSTGDPGAAAIFNTTSNVTSNGRPLLTDTQILRMRRELSQNLATPDLGAPGTVSTLDGSLDANIATGTTPQSRSLTAPPPTPFETPENRSLSPQSLSGNAIVSTANDLSTGQGSVDRLASPSQQSSQYAEMRRRLDRYNTQQQPKSAEQLNQEFRTQFQQQQQQQQQQQTGVIPQRPAGQGANQPSGQQQQQQQQGRRSLTGEDLGKRARDIAEGRIPAGGPQQPKGEAQTYVHNPTGGVTAVVPTLPNERPEPVEVHSLATGVKAEGLRGLLEKAEGLMRDGKFDSAIAQYESAAQVAPNNPMILLGQANAELGGEYFARAENHLRQSFLLDPTLLMARYDLRAMIGDQRLNDLVGSLKQIAAKETTQSRPAFLLAYIAYNTHDGERAASYLDLAEKRAAAPDPVFRLLRTHWDLPKSAAAPSAPAGLNK